MIKRVLLLFLLVLPFASAKQYDTTVMAIEAKLFPKIALLEQHIKGSGASTLEITIFAIDSDRHAAKTFKEQIESAYPKGILNRKLIVNVKSFDTGKKDRPDAVIVLSHSPEQLQAIASWANEKRIVSLAYDPYYLRYGLLASIYFGKSAKPYLNRKANSENGFVFDHYFLNLTKFYDE